MNGLRSPTRRDHRETHRMDMRSQVADRGTSSYTTLSFRCCALAGSRPGLSPREEDTPSTPRRRRQTSRVKPPAISNGIGSLHREHYGRGADRIRTTIHTEPVITVLQDCFTTVEKRMIAEGEFRKVRETRIMFQDWMGPKLIRTVEDATGRKVPDVQRKRSSNAPGALRQT